MAQRRSNVWEYFTVNAADNSRVTCNLCSTSVSRGSKSASAFNTSNMRIHLLGQHPSVSLAAKTPRATEVARSPAGCEKKQQSVMAAFSHGKPWEFNDPRSLRLTRLIAEMIAVDDQPFSVVCDDGFRRLVHALEPRYTLPSDTYMRKTAVPELYKLVRDTVHKVVSKVESMSLTTDTWTTSMCSESLISLTGHWIDASWQRQSAVLQTSHLPGSHTAANIKEKNPVSDQ